MQPFLMWPLGVLFVLAVLIYGSWLPIPKNRLVPYSNSDPLLRGAFGTLYTRFTFPSGQQLLLKTDDVWVDRTMPDRHMKYVTKKVLGLPWFGGTFYYN